ncbi:MAG: hypothetical protein GXZ07_07320 [Firmicutes bacterium]|nr:hypothetical protein [Bacillota bacterium]
MIINNGELISKDDIETMVEAGPLLILNGVIVFDPDNKQFTEDKINLSPAQRSAIGINSKGHVLMVTGSNLKMIELAKIMHELGCVAATNLDGGASSALYANGKYITYPGRKLNTVLVVYDSEDTMSLPVQSGEIQVLLDGYKVTFDVPPMSMNGYTLVPLRGIFEAMGVDIVWEEKSRTITAQTDETTVVLPIGSRTAKVNNRIVQLDVPGVIVGGRTMVPIRFIAESLGKEVKWDQKSKTVMIISDTLERSKKNN